MGGHWWVATMKAGPWKDRDEFEEWWRKNVVAFNRLAVTDPEAWERVTQAIEKFHKENKR